MKWMTKHTMTQLVVLAMAAVIIPVMVRISAAATEAGRKTESKLAVIESISVSGDGDGTELVIKLSSPAVYTSYKTTAPLRLVVDLSQATQGGITAPIVINKGNFKDVTVNRYDTDAGVLTRIDIGLVKDAEALFSTAPGSKAGLRISFPVPVETAVTTPAASSEIAAVKAPESVAVDAAKTPADPAPTGAATTEASKTAMEAPPHSLTAISVKDNAIILEIDGGVGEFKSFRLNKPERLVVDLFDVTNGLAGRVVPVNAAGVALARIGVYPDKIRVVFDAINGSFPGAVAVRSDKGVTILLSVTSAAEAATVQPSAASSGKVAGMVPQAGTKPAVAVPTPAVLQPSEKQPARPPKAAAEKQVSAAPVAPPAVEPPLKRPDVKHVEKPVAKSSVRPAVEMIDFQVVDGISRISVKVAGDVVVSAPVKTPGFVTLTIKHASLPKRLQRSLETESFATSPVMRVTPYLVKTRAGTDARIKIALRAPAEYNFKQQGDMLFVDFKNPEEVMAEKVPAEFHEPRHHVGGTARASVSRDTEISSDLVQSAEPSGKSLGTVRVYKGRKVTLEFADAEVRKIFQLLSEVSNKNFVLGDDVTGTISIKLVNVPWDQALDIILDAKGLDKREDGNIVIIKGKGKFKSDIELEQENKKALTRSMEMRTETFSVNYANIADIRAQFEKLKQHERASITDDARTNKVIVRDIPQAIEDMRKLKEQLDVPEKQVMIEARIVEATSTFTRNLGVSWGVHYRDGSASFLGINNLDTGFGGLTSAAPTSGTGTSAGGSMGISFGTLASNIKLDMRLNAAASAGLIKIISTPKVATINNKTAKITQGQQIPYQNTTAQTGAVTQFVEAALALEVTPHINANGTIGMKIDAKNDAPGTSSGTGPPPINKKQATTEMLLRDGETTVIGGIYVDSDTESDDGVPFLMDIPLLGKLFKSNTKTKTKTELLIFITPRIIGTI